jgi:hypothetical protein
VLRQFVVGDDVGRTVQLRVFARRALAQRARALGVFVGDILALDVFILAASGLSVFRGEVVFLLLLARLAGHVA